MNKFETNLNIIFQNYRKHKCVILLLLLLHSESNYADVQ